MRRSFGKESPKGLALPHPQSRQHQHGKEDVPGRCGVLRKVLERTVNVAGDRNGKDDVNPAEDRTFGGAVHGWVFNLFDWRRRCRARQTRAPSGACDAEVHKRSPGKRTRAPANYAAAGTWSSVAEAAGRFSLRRTRLISST